ncbi:hypothetical protein BOMU111920_15015 [Bordetella muralis]|jgi:hypothetical protein
MFTRMLRYLTAHASLPKPTNVLLGDTGIALPREQCRLNAGLCLGEIALSRGRLCARSNIGIDPRCTQASTQKHHDR